MKNSININVELPDDYLLISKNEYYSLIDNNALPTKTWWSMRDLELETGFKREWLKRNILQNPKYKKEIELFTHYPMNRNDEYRFIGSKMQQFLEEKFTEIFN